MPSARLEDEVNIPFRDRAESGALLFLLEVVVVDFDAEDDAAAGRGDEVGQEERPDDVGLVDEPLYHEGEAANCHHQEGGKGNAVGVARANGLYGLGQITQHHAYAGYDAANVEDKVVGHEKIEN